MGVRNLKYFPPSDSAIRGVKKTNLTIHLIKPTEQRKISSPARFPLLSTEWISKELLSETRKLWSKAYGRVISIEEAIEILMNVKLLAEVLMRLYKENKLK